MDCISSVSTKAPVRGRAVENSRLNSLSFVFPMFNEIGNIERCIMQALAVGPQLADDFEIIVVDDASNDGSGPLCDRMAMCFPELRVIHHYRNQKFGGALRTGFAAAKMDWILYTDSDLPVRLADSVRAVPLTRIADMVIGFRLRRSDGMKRRLMSLIYNWLIGMLFDLRVRDVNFAFKLFKRSLLGDLELRSDGGFIDAELLIEARRSGVQIAEIGMEFQPRMAGKSTLGSLSAICTIIHNIAIYRRRRNRRASSGVG